MTKTVLDPVEFDADNSAKIRATRRALPLIELHDIDYRLLEDAAAISGYDIAEFAKLVIYRTSLAVVEGDQHNWLSALPAPRFARS
ncbi:hypothetical protein [Cupriavidus pauculus]|uniref:hypothetical protein n=1 Tax=Cupriavidus pauculus TaxID=82633 RepID=UPI003857CF48